MGQAHRGDEFMFQALGPDGIEQGVRQVQLGDLDGVHGHGADEDKGHRFPFQVQEPGQQTHGKNADDGPEQHLEDGEDVAPVHQGAAGAEGPDLIQVSA